MRSVILAGALAALLPMQPVARQQEPADEARFRSASSDLVVVPVTVTDKRGALVTDLPRDRFVVFDNNQREDIAFFTNEDTPVSVALVIDCSGSMRPKMGEVV